MKYKIIVDKQPSSNPSSEKKQYVIEIEELRVKGDVYDSIVITKDEDYVMRRLSINDYQVLSILENPVKEYLNINIELFEGDNYIYLMDMTGNKFYAEYLIKNEFNDIYVTTKEMSSAINQTAQQIELTVSQKLTGYSTTEEMNSAINMKVDSITSSVNKKLENYDTSEEVNSKIEQKADSITSTINSTITNKLADYSTTTQMNSAITQKANEITSSVSSTYETKTNVDTKISTAKSEIKQTTDNITSTVSKKVGKDEVISSINQSAETVGINASKINLTANDILNLMAGNAINLTSKNITITSNAFNVDKNGKVSCSNIDITGGNVNLKSTGSGDTSTSKVTIENTNGEKVTMSSYKMLYKSGSDYVLISSFPAFRMHASDFDIQMMAGNLSVSNGTSASSITYAGIETPKLTQTSLKSKKKNIKKLKVNATDLIKNADICLYNLKGEKAKSKKHIGLVIGDGYNCPEEVISEDGQGVEQYSMTSIAWKAIQELIEENKNLKQRMKNLEKEVANGKN